MATWFNKAEEVLEDFGISAISFYGCDGREYCECEFYSDAGEDFIFTLETTSKDAFVNSLTDYYEDFDPEEHAVFWYNSERCELSLRWLLDDADSIDEKLKDLTESMTEILGTA